MSGRSRHPSHATTGPIRVRQHDNEILHRAATLKKAEPGIDVVPLFCYDPRWLSSGRCGAFRSAFLVEAVNDLSNNLQAIGSDLVVARGAPEDIIPRLIPAGVESVVFAQREIASEEVAVERAVRRALPAGATLELVWGSLTLYHPDDLREFGNIDVGNIPSPAMKFIKLVGDERERKLCIREPIPAPAPGDLGEVGEFQDLMQVGDVITERNPVRKVEDLGVGLKTPKKDPRRAFRTQGGETAALARWAHYLDSHAVSTYFETRNGMIGEDYSTKLGPALAHGCISPRTVWRATRRYEERHGANKSTSWIEFELLVRDWWKWFATTHGNAIFREGGPIGAQKAWEQDIGGEKFRRWVEGRTGWPLVDANMRELALTGFMSNRGRQNVASFLCLDLGLDWRLGAGYFEVTLVDYDVESNWGSWVAAAGLTGGRVNKFNIVKQSRQYDELGEYIKLWMPELADVPLEEIHEPRPGALSSVFMLANNRGITTKERTDRTERA